MRSSAYERRFAELVGGDVAAFAFWKGRIALYAILRAMGIGHGDEVVMPGFTCVVVATAVRLTGATPVYADISPRGFNVDVSRAERLLTSRTKAIIVQHTFGTPAPIDEFVEAAQARELRVIEDCAHTVAGSYNGRHLGSIGDAGFYSFQWSKPYTTGLGGMAVTRDPELAERLRNVRDSFLEPPLSARLRLGVQYWLYSHFFTSRRYWLAQDVLHGISRVGLFVGSSSKGELEGEEPVDHTWLMSARQQNVGAQLLGTVQARSRHSDVLAARYDAHLAPAGWPIPERSADAPLLRYPLLVANREDLLAKSRRARVELGTWFESPLHPIPLGFHRLHGYTLGECPIAERTARQIVNLPLHMGITLDEADRIAGFINNHAARQSAS